MRLRARRLSIVIAALVAVLAWLVINPESYESTFIPVEDTEAGEENVVDQGGVDGEVELLAINLLERLEVKGRAPKTGYNREEFYASWPIVDGCSLRQRIIKREFGDSAVLNGCDVVAGEFDEPYTGEHRVFTEKSQISKIQIDHVVALSDAWQKGAQYKSREIREQIATDPLNLLAVDGKANNQKSDGDAATWLPSNKKFRCQYVARQISVKYKYELWVTEAEKGAMQEVLAKCPNEPSVGIE